MFVPVEGKETSGSTLRRGTHCSLLTRAHPKVYRGCVRRHSTRPPYVCCAGAFGGGPHCTQRCCTQPVSPLLVCGVEYSRRMAESWWGSGYCGIVSSIRSVWYRGRVSWEHRASSTPPFLNGGGSEASLSARTRRRHARALDAVGVGPAHMQLVLDPQVFHR